MNIAVFASGNGSNFQAIAEAVKQGRIKANLSILVCDNPDAFVLQRAKKYDVRVFLAERKKFKSKDEFEAGILTVLRKEKIGLIVLAGYMRLLGAGFVEAYSGRIINIHPSLLPSFKGAEGIKDAFLYGVKVTGVTVHFVDEYMDNGPVILQAAIEVEDTDTQETLAEKIHKREHNIYPEAIRLFTEGRLKIEGRKVFVGAEGGF